MCVSVCFRLISETAALRAKVSILVERSPYVMQKMWGFLKNTFVSEIEQFKALLEMGLSSNIVSRFFQYCLLLYYYYYKVFTSMRVGRCLVDMHAIKILGWGTEEETDYW